MSSYTPWWWSRRQPEVSCRACRAEREQCLLDATKPSESGPRRAAGSVHARSSPTHQLRGFARLAFVLSRKIIQKSRCASETKKLQYNSEPANYAVPVYTVATASRFRSYTFAVSAFLPVLRHSIDLSMCSVSGNHRTLTMMLST